MRYLRILRDQPRPFRFLASRLLWRSRACRLITIDCGAFRLRFAPSSLSARYWVEPQARQGDHAFLASYLRPGDTYVDVGANIGALALHAATLVGARGRVSAIEAHPRTFGFLRDNVRLNGAAVTALNYAAGEESGTLRFTSMRGDDKNGVSAQGALEVPVRPLDELLAALDGPIHLLKLDVEGFELPVLRGAAAVLARTECVYFEVSLLSDGYGHPAEAVVAELAGQGFTVLDDAGEPVARPFVASRRTANLTAVRSVARFRARTAAAAEPALAGDAAA